MTDREYEEMIQERDAFIAQLQAENSKLKTGIEEERAACLDIAEAWTALTGPENSIAAMTARKIARKIRARSQRSPTVD